MACDPMDDGVYAVCLIGAGIRAGGEGNAEAWSVAMGAIEGLIDGDGVDENDGWPVAGGRLLALGLVRKARVMVSEMSDGGLVN